MQDEDALAKERGFTRQQDWARYRIFLKKELKSKGIPFNRDDSTVELERKAPEIFTVKSFHLMERNNGEKR